MIIVKKELIEKLVVDETMDLLMNDVLLEQLADKFISLQSQENTRMPLQKKSLVIQSAGIENRLNAI